MDKLDREILVTHLKTVRAWGKILDDDLLDLVSEYVTCQNEVEILERIDEEVYHQIAEAKQVAWQDGYDEGFAEYEWEIDRIRDDAYQEGYDAATAELEAEKCTA